MASDIVVFPSTEPHQARPIYEAGAAKKPIVITDFKETLEFVKDGFNALTFSNGKFKDLAEKINMLKNNEALYISLIENNYKQTIEKHDLSKLSGELDMFLSNV